MLLLKAVEQDFDEMIFLWEASVRATHSFLKEQDIISLRKLIREEIFYLECIDIRILKDVNSIVGFVGVSESNIEMLFVEPRYFGKDVGIKLLNYAIKEKKANKVDVNEQNPRALKFYQKYGFEKVGRSELDNQGNKFPILHMELKNA